MGMLEGIIEDMRERMEDNDWGKNELGDTILDFPSAFDLVIANT